MSALALQVIAEIAVVGSPWGVAVNPITNRVYVANSGGASVSVIDGVTNAVITTIPVGPQPEGVAVNPITNRIYVANYNGASMSVIDGATDAVVATVAVNPCPRGVAVNISTNRIYVTGNPGSLVSVVDGATNALVTNIAVGSSPESVAVNSTTNRVYVTRTPGFVSVIDGVSNALVATLPVGLYPEGVAINPGTNRVYVAYHDGASVSVIDGASNTFVATIPVGTNPMGVAVDATTNRVYVAIHDEAPFFGNPAVSVINGASNTVITTVPVGQYPKDVAVNPITNRVYVINRGVGTLSVIDASVTPALTLLPQPIRLADTRTAGQGPVAGGTSRCFTVAGQAGIPPDAVAAILNLTATGYAARGWLTVYPNGQPVSATSSLNFEPNSYATSNGVIARIGGGGQVCVNVGTANNVPGSANIILDATGYQTGPAAGDMPMLVQPQRLVDTRGSSGPVPTGTSRCFQMTGKGGITTDAAGVLLNITGVGATTRGWLTVYPNGQSVPATSTVNVEPNSYATANGAIARIGTDGQVCVNFGTVDSVPGSSQVILDATAYLPSGGAASMPLLSEPQRLVDTRSSGGPVWAGTSRCFTLAGRGGIPADATGVILNVTAVGYTAPGWISLFPGQQSVPATSTVNFDGSKYAIGNQAIVSLGSGGSVCANVGAVDSRPGSTQVILDVTGYLPAASPSTSR